MQDTTATQPSAAPERLASRATAPSAVEVRFPASGQFGTADFWGEHPEAVQVQWRASTGLEKLVVCVTAYTSTHRNHSWYDSRFFVAEGLDQSDPPAWVPPAPEWFWTAVESMAVPMVTN